jgi:hypothetical protein
MALSAEERYVLSSVIAGVAVFVVTVAGKTSAAFTFTGAEWVRVKRPTAIVRGLVADRVTSPVWIGCTEKRRHERASCRRRWVCCTSLLQGGSWRHPTGGGCAFGL